MAFWLKLGKWRGLWLWTRKHVGRADLENVCGLWSLFLGQKQTLQLRDGVSVNVWVLPYRACAIFCFFKDWLLRAWLSSNWSCQLLESVCIHIYRALCFRHKVSIFGEPQDISSLFGALKSCRILNGIAYHSEAVRRCWWESDFRLMHF